MAKTVLITGSQGFTGQYMTEELLSAGYRVVGLGSQPDDNPDYIQVDITDPDAVRASIAVLQPDIVVHLAAVAFVGEGNANSFYQVNVIGTRNLLDALAAADKPPETVLLASSANVYGNQRGGKLDERAPAAPANDYAVSKLAMEHMARLWLPRLPIIIARPFNYTGVGQGEQFLVPKIVSHFKRRAAVIELGNLDVWRDFSDIRSVVAAYRALIEQGPVGEAFNVASGQPHSLKEILTLCAEITGHELEVRVNPAFVRANEVKTLCGDAAKLRACIGDWEKSDLRNTLRWMLADNV